MADADVDWAAGQVTGKGLGVADRHAPSPAAAREPARRAAEDAAKKAIAAQLGGLPLAAGGTLKAKLADKAIAARIDLAVAAAITIDATPHTDGSWNVTLALPIEAIRQAIDGPRVLPPASTGSGSAAGGNGDADPPIVIIDGVNAKPAIGYKVGGVAGATLWVKAVPDWGASAPHVKATGTKAGAIDIDKSVGGASTLFLVVTK